MPVVTRVNLGIPPAELCDQHLLAEYRELPRMISFARRCTRPAPKQFTLGKGHMTALVPYGATLAERWQNLRDEMVYRGFKPALDPSIFNEYPPALMGRCSSAYARHARTVLRARIESRLRTAKRKPTWTRRTWPLQVVGGVL